MDFVGECYIIQRPYLHSEVIGYNTLYKKSHNQRTAYHREITGGGRVCPEGRFAPVSPKGMLPYVSPAVSPAVHLK